MVVVKGGGGALAKVLAVSGPRGSHGEREVQAVMEDLDSIWGQRKGDLRGPWAVSMLFQRRVSCIPLNLIPLDSPEWWGYKIPPPSPQIRMSRSTCCRAAKRCGRRKRPSRRIL